MSDQERINEIVYILRICASDKAGSCQRCPYIKHGGRTCSDLLCKNAADAIEALLRENAALRAQEQNEPLTLEQVKARKWVWIDNDTACRNRGWAKVFSMYDLAKLEAVSYSFSSYGKTWIAYDHEPKGDAQ